jgi:hypothetical protein
MGMNNEFNYRSRRSRPDSKLSLLEQRRRTRSPEDKKPREPDTRIQALLQRPAGLAGVELAHKIIKGQFGLPESFGTDPFHVWYNVLAA